MASPQTTSETADGSAMVVGASRGLGRGIAIALAEAGRPVVAVARSGTELAALARDHENITPRIADASEPSAAGSLLDRDRPTTLVVVAGASPLMRPLQQQTWETFSANWNTDVRITFHWIRDVLLNPLAAGSRVVVFSSGAAVFGSPLSGGYAGANATQRFITAYAQDEADQAGLDLSFTAIMPRMTAETDLGLAAARAYAARGGVEEQTFIDQMGPPVTPAIAGDAVVELIRRDRGDLRPGYLLTGGGLQNVPGPAA